MGSSQSLPQRRKRQRRKTTTSHRKKQGREFHDFSKLSDDIALEIISFIAEGPFEGDGNVQSPLTHVLPFVNMQFHNICNSDLLWMASLQRLSYKHPNKCKQTFKKLLKSGTTNPKWSTFYQSTVDKDDFMLAAMVQNMDTLNQMEISGLVERICRSVAESVNDGKDSITHFDSLFNNKRVRNDSDTNMPIDRASNFSVRSMYLTVVREFSFITLPIFHMRYNALRPDVQMNLTFFEARYRMLIREIMEGRKGLEKRGRSVEPPRPRFIFANDRTIGNGSKAFLVEVTRCRLMEGGRAHIMIKPLKKVKLLSVCERHGVDNGLQDGRIKRFVE